MPFRLYKVAVGFMLAHPYGFTRVMSSYRWARNFVNGQVSFGVVQKISFSQGEEVLLAHDAVTYTTYFVKYLGKASLLQGSFSNTVDIKK